MPEAGTGFYIEAESGTLSGFTVRVDATASGARFIEPPSIAATQPGTALAVYTFQIATAGTYVIWGRIHSPDATHNRFTVRVDGGTSYTWRISTGDVWYWDAFHDNLDYDNPIRFNLAAGRHQLFVSDLVDVVGLDRIYITANGDTPRGTTPPIHPIDLAGELFAKLRVTRGYPNMTTANPPFAPANRRSATTARSVAFGSPTASGRALWGGQGPLIVGGTAPGQLARRKMTRPSEPRGRVLCTPLDLSEQGASSASKASSSVSAKPARMARSLKIASACSWQARDSVTPSRSPISRRVQSCW